MDIKRHRSLIFLLWKYLSKTSWNFVRCQNGLDFSKQVLLIFCITHRTIWRKRQAKWFSPILQKLWEQDKCFYILSKNIVKIVECPNFFDFTKQVLPSFWLMHRTIWRKRHANQFRQIMRKLLEQNKCFCILSTT